MTLISKLAISLFISVTSIFVLAKPPAPTAQEMQPAPITVWQGLKPATPLPTVGFPEAELATVVAVAYRESRCLPDAFNANDTVGQSYGTMQVNDFWCLPSKYYPNGYMQAYGLLTVCDDLFDLETNLRAALNIWRYSNGWRAWSL